jgi:hypothetical protein
MKYVTQLCGILRKRISRCDSISIGYASRASDLLSATDIYRISSNLSPRNRMGYSRGQSPYEATQPTLDSFLIKQWITLTKQKQVMPI